MSSNNLLENHVNHISQLENALANSKNKWYELYLRFKDSDPALAEEMLSEHNALSDVGTFTPSNFEQNAIVPLQIDPNASNKSLSVIRWFRSTSSPTVADFKGFWLSIHGDTMPETVSEMIKSLNIPDVNIPPSIISSIVYALYLEGLGVTVNVK